ncbi:MAG: hypothetical protein R3242_00235 [Akkermansiaceae bacterium]|nr:hypothetical protein [Akkermansiaceae bacterium]
MFDWNLTTHIIVLILSSTVIVFAGSKLSKVADRLADRTGLGEAMIGAILLGASTSLAGSVVSVTTAWQGHAQLAFSNGIGGIAAQTAFLAIADLCYRRANLEHAATSLPNIIHGLVLIGLLGCMLMGAYSPDWTLWGIHPVSFILLGGYLFGLRLARIARDEPMWTPRTTQETREDEPDETPEGESLAGLWIRFAVLLVTLGCAGFFVAESGMGLVAQSGLKATVVGALFTAVATSTPELVTTIAAVRQGALTLAVGGILGGNVFDVLFAVGADVAYREGSIYHAIGPNELLLVCLGLLLTTILVLGLITREKYGPAKIGVESILILLVYLGGVVLIALG